MYINIVIRILNRTLYQTDPEKDRTVTEQISIHRVILT